jgi:hypothetical protein
MTAPNEPNDELNSNRLKDSAYHVKARAAEKKLEALFDLLRRPAMNISVGQMSSA